MYSVVLLGVYSCAIHVTYNSSLHMHVPPSLWYCLLTTGTRKHYIDVERREEGFDCSGPRNPSGEFTSSRGVSHCMGTYKLVIDNTPQTIQAKKSLCSSGESDVLTLYSKFHKCSVRASGGNVELHKNNTTCEDISCKSLACRKLHKMHNFEIYCTQALICLCVHYRNIATIPLPVSSIQCAKT